MFKPVRMPFFSAEEGGGDDNHQESGKITFTPEQQAHMDKIIGQRITSEKAKYAGYDDMKEIVETMEQFGYTGSVSDKKAAFKAYAEERRKARELAELEEEADKVGTSPELLAEIKQVKAELAEMKKDKQKNEQEMQEKQKQADSWKEQVEEFSLAHADVDVAKLYENKKFMEFVADSRPGLTLLQVYDKYIDLIGSAEKAAIEKIKSNNDRSTSSGRAKGSPDDGTYGLSEYQQQLAAKNGMTNKQYAELRKQVAK